MSNNILFFTIIILLSFQLLNAFRKRNNWNILVQMNSIGMKVLTLFMFYAVMNALPYILDIILVLLVLNVVGTIIISRYNSKN